MILPSWSFFSRVHRRPSHFFFPFGLRMSRWAIFRSRRAKLYSLKRGTVVEGPCFSPRRISSSRVSSHDRASSGVSSCRRLRTSTSLPVRGSTADARTSQPPSRHFQTPGSAGCGASHVFHFSTHCSCFAISFLSDHERVEVLAPPGQCSRTTATTCRLHATSLVRVKKAARR